MSFKQKNNASIYPKALLLKSLKQLVGFVGGFSARPYFLKPKKSKIKIPAFKNGRIAKNAAKDFVNKFRNKTLSAIH